MQPPICLLRHSLKMQLQLHYVTSWSPPDFLPGEHSKHRHSLWLPQGSVTGHTQTFRTGCLQNVSGNYIFFSNLTLRPPWLPGLSARCSQLAWPEFGRTGPLKAHPKGVYL